jgi:hypothetical protein
MTREMRFRKEKPNTGVHQECPATVGNAALGGTSCFLDNPIYFLCRDEERGWA